jgi:aryl-alcohol dehydrogenase-like predicted oxidoreductase
VANDFRSRSPRFSRENLDRNLELADALAHVAESQGATAAQAAIAWVLGRGDDIVALVGARRRDRLIEALGALTLEMGEDDLATIERAVPADQAAGDRYDARGMATLDSER